MTTDPNTNGLQLCCATPPGGVVKTGAPPNGKRMNCVVDGEVCQLLVWLCGREGGLPAKAVLLPLSIVLRRTRQPPDQDDYPKSEDQNLIGLYPAWADAGLLGGGKRGGGALGPMLKKKIVGQKGFQTPGSPGAYPGGGPKGALPPPPPPKLTPAGLN